MSASSSPLLQDCQLMSRENGLDLYCPKTKIHIVDEKNEIKIMHIGKPNDLPLKTMLLIGETGAGKSTLLNRLYNHLCNIKYKDKYRFKFSDEVGDSQKASYESQTEWVTGYLFFHQPGMRYKYNILVIDTPGLGDTRGTEKQDNIAKQMQTFLKEEKFGIIDLHCLGFVIKSSMNRNLEYFGKFLKQCMEILGEDTKLVTYVLNTFAVDKSRNTKEILKVLGLEAERLFNFDNGVLFVPNQSGVIDLHGDTIEEDDLEDFDRRWKKQDKCCDDFFRFFFMMPSVSLALTREAIRKKGYLEHARRNLWTHIESALEHILAIQKTKKILKDIEENIEDVSSWKDQEHMVPIKYRTSIETKWYQWGGHVHNCTKCDQTCTETCHFWYSWCNFKYECEACSCDSGSHESSKEIIQTRWEKQTYQHPSKIANLEKAEDRRAAMHGEMEKLKREEDKLVKDIATKIKYTSVQTEKLRHLSRIKVSPQSPSEIIEEIIGDVIQKNPLFHKCRDNDFIHKNPALQAYLNEDFYGFLQTVYQEVDKININIEEWEKNIDKNLKKSDVGSIGRMVKKALNL